MNPPPCSTSRQRLPLGPQNGRPKSHDRNHPLLPPPLGVIYAIPRWEAGTGECLDKLRFLIREGWVTRAEGNFHPTLITFSTTGSASDRTNAPVWHVHGGTLMSEKVERVLSGVITTVCVRRTWIRDIIECERMKHILPLAPKPPNGNPGTGPQISHAKFGAVVKPSTYRESAKRPHCKHNFHCGCC